MNLQRKAWSLGLLALGFIWHKSPAKKSEKKLVCLGWQSARAELTLITRSGLACSLPSYQSIGGSEQRTAHRPPQSTEAETFSLGGALQR